MFLTKKTINLIFLLIILFLPILVQAQTQQLNPFVEGDTVTIVGYGIKIVLGLIGTLALIFIIYGGVTWMTAAGNVEKIKKGKASFVWAILGLVACFLAYSVVSFMIIRIVGN